jgi:hypothetical protein
MTPKKALPGTKPGRTALPEQITQDEIQVGTAMDSKFHLEHGQHSPGHEARYGLQT